MRKAYLIVVIFSMGSAACDGSSNGIRSSLSGDGGNSNGPSFQDLCDQGASLMCDRAASCGSTQPKADCIAQGKAQNCAGGVEQYCGVGHAFLSDKVPACLDALRAITCLALGQSMPEACAPEALCSPSSGGDPIPAPGEACQPVGVSDACRPQASLCYAAGTPSSCPDKGLCVGDGQGMTCAARCTADADCSSAGVGMVCLQGCAVSILNGYCTKFSARATLMNGTCSDKNHGSTTGIAGWSL